MGSTSIRVGRRSLIGAAALFSLAAGVADPAWAAAAAGCSALGPVPPVIEVVQGQQQELRFPQAVTRVAIGDPTVADVHVNSPEAFLVTGVQAGVTSLMVWTACSPQPRQSMLFVKGGAIASVTVPATRIADDPSLPDQVQTDIRFVEVSRTKLKEVGTSLFGQKGNVLFGAPGTVPGSATGTNLGVTPGTVGSIVPTIPLNNGSFNIAWGTGKFLGLINALETSGFAYTLARPSLVALSGQSASFLAGGEFPVPVPSGNGDNISIEYKEFGVRLTLTPTVIGRNRITLKVAPEVSELDYTSGVTIAGTTVPALNVRRTDTSISLADGESFVISGLISNRNISSVDKFPGLGDIPVLGAFFRTSSVNREERELLMIVTPHLVQPLSANANLPELPGERLRTYDPNAAQLFFLENGDYDRRSGLSQ